MIDVKPATDEEIAMMRACFGPASKIHPLKRDAIALIARIDAEKQRADAAEAKLVKAKMALQFVDRHTIHGPILTDAAIQMVRDVLKEMG